MKILYKFRNKHSELYLSCYYCEHWWMFTYSSRLAEWMGWLDVELV